MSTKRKKLEHGPGLLLELSVEDGAMHISGFNVKQERGTP